MSSTPTENPSCFPAKKDEIILRSDAQHWPHLEHPAFVSLLSCNSVTQMSLVMKRFGSEWLLWDVRLQRGLVVTEYLCLEELKNLPSKIYLTPQVCPEGSSYRCVHKCAQSQPFMCFPVAVSLQGYADATHWKIYLIARGVQPLVFCDATTVSEL